MSAVDEGHFVHAAEKEGHCCAELPLLPFNYCFALVKHPVAGGAVGPRPASPLLPQNLRPSVVGGPAKTREKIYDHTSTMMESWQSMDCGSQEGQRLSGCSGFHSTWKAIASVPSVFAQFPFSIVICNYAVPSQVP